MADETPSPDEQGPPPHSAGGKPSPGDVVSEAAAAVKAASQREPFGWFAFASFVFTVVWLLWWEDSAMGFWKLKLWTLFILAAEALVFAPLVRNSFKITEHRAWQLAAAGAGGMMFAWVAFLLPNIQSNQAFFGTLAAACAAIAAWTAPGRPKD